MQVTTDLRFEYWKLQNEKRLFSLEEPFNEARLLDQWQAGHRISRLVENEAKNFQTRPIVVFQ